VTIRRWEDVPRCLVPKLGSPGRLARIANVDTLGDDLVLLSLNPRSGRVSTVRKIGYGLMGSELVRLAAAGSIRKESRADPVAHNQAPARGRRPGQAGLRCRVHRAARSEPGRLRRQLRRVLRRGGKLLLRASLRAAGVRN
jgi:hypothetical protein